MPEKYARRGKVLFFANVDSYLDYNISENRRNRDCAVSPIKN
jgi:hypothetical protein